MKKIVPFKKELFFEDDIYEITSISLEHTLHHENDYLISGEFILEGEYKNTEEATNTKSFKYDLPFDINIDERYILDKVQIDIDDFYYEILNDNVLLVNIDVKLDKLEEKNERIKLENIVNDSKDDIDKFFSESIKLIPEKEDNKVKEEVTNITTNIQNNDGFVTYKVYILKDEDNVDTIINKYNVSRDLLADYNDLTDLRSGDKIIIPTNE